MLNLIHLAQSFILNTGSSWRHKSPIYRTYLSTALSRNLILDTRIVLKLGKNPLKMQIHLEMKIYNKIFPSFWGLGIKQSYNITKILLECSFRLKIYLILPAPPINSTTVTTLLLTRIALEQVWGVYTNPSIFRAGF